MIWILLILMILAMIIFGFFPTLIGGLLGYFFAQKGGFKALVGKKEKNGVALT